MKSFALCLLLLLAPSANAQTSAPPDDVHVKLSLADAKSVYRIGEPIKLIMEFTETSETILMDHSDLEPDDLRACLAYAHTVIAHDKLDSIHISG